ncbi:NADP-dependent oxidoreductase [Microbacterium kribbense]|uniref:NADP-dependent oxidoreductase n=1 Tax=Microbacterium kribbense TaxID=433645 RepID=A0ABP7G7P3_9MICO
MQAVRFDQYGDVDVLQVREVDDPPPGAHQVIVRVRAAGINPGEASIRRGDLDARWPAHFPEGEGSDLAGVVTAVGADVAGFAVGDEVIGFTNNRASHAELVAVGDDELTHKPESLAWDVAGALFVAGTSGRAIVDAVHIVPGETVVVVSAAGGTGAFTTQLARGAGARVIGLAGPDNHEWLREVGAIPVDYHGDGLADRIRAAAGGAPIAAMLDTHGGGYVQLGLDLGIEPRRVASLADFRAGEKGATAVGHAVAAKPEVLRELADDIVAGRLQVPIAARYPLAEVRAAYTELERRRTRGKIVLIP